MNFFKPDLLIYYSIEYFLGLCEKGPRSTFDCHKFKKVKEKLITEKIVKSKNIIEPTPVTWDDFKLVHDENYLNKLKNPINVAKILFLDYVSPFDNDIMEFFMWVTGGTVEAVNTAFTKNIPCFNLGGGYHHGKKNKGEGFCPVNDVAVAIKKLWLKNGKCKIFIVDLDYHHGNGTATIFNNEPNVFSFSIHRDNWDDVNPKYNKNILLPDHTDDKTYLTTLQNLLPETIKQQSPDMVIYIAGGDPFIEDTLGTFNITKKGILERDIFVYNTVTKDMKLPIAVVGGGGYGLKSWELYFNFIAWVAKGKKYV
jgi:acetoin utilization deacetylase AcuC-like enzyme